MEPKRKGAIRRLKGDRRYFDRRDDEERRQLPVDSLVNKILVTGSRNWNDISLVVEQLKGYRPGTILIHGACQGADIICAAVAETLGFIVRGYPADWDGHGRAAGPIRNQQMLTLEHKPDEPIDLCLAFHDDIMSSAGTADMINRVVKAGIPHKLNTSCPRSSAELECRSAKPEVTGSNPVEGTDVTCTKSNA